MEQAQRVTCARRSLEASDLILEAHAKEREILVLVGLTPGGVADMAPAKVPETGTRWRFVLGMAALAKSIDQGRPLVALPAGSAGRVLALQRAASDLYWQAALKTKTLAQRHWRWLGEDQDAGTQEGLIWLHKAAQLFRPEAGHGWRPYAKRWLRSQKHRHQWGPVDRYILEAMATINANGGDGGRTAADLSRAFGLPLRTVEQALVARRSFVPTASVDEEGRPVRIDPIAKTVDPLAAFEVLDALSRVDPRDAYATICQFGLFGAKERHVERSKKARSLALQALRSTSLPSRARCNPTAVLWTVLMDEGASAQEVADRLGVAVETVAAGVAAVRSAMDGQP